MRSASETSSPCRRAGASDRACSLSVSTRPLRSSAMTGSGKPATTAWSGSPARSATATGRARGSLPDRRVNATKAAAATMTKPGDRIADVSASRIAQCREYRRRRDDHQAQPAPSSPLQRYAIVIQAHRNRPAQPPGRQTDQVTSDFSCTSPATAAIDAGPDGASRRTATTRAALHALRGSKARA